MFTSFLMSSQSESMTPSKPSSPRRTSVSRYLLTCPGMPFTSPEFTITDSAPAFTPAANVGSARFRRGDPARLEHQLRIPRRRHAERLRKQRRAHDVIGAVDGVEPVDDGDLQARLARGVLNGADQLVPLRGRQRQILDVE